MIKFLYCVGTSYMTADMAKAADLVYSAPPPGVGYLVKGLRGLTTSWGGGPPGDPFPSFLDPNVFEAKKVFYDASTIGMGDSIAGGIANVVTEINALTAGQKFCLGGYSQGAAVMSGVYNELRSGSLTGRNADFLGGVMFGNPRRQKDYRGSVGGTWSGSSACFETLGATLPSTGGHGSFPTSGPYARLANCELGRWQEFTHPNDIFSSVPDNILGDNWVTSNSVFLTNTWQAWATYVLTNALGALAAGITLAFANNALPLVDALGNTFTTLPGMGHVAYPFLPPIGNPDGNLTAYQIAIKYLEGLAAQFSVAPILLPSTPTTTANAGWSTTVVTPAL